MCDLTPYVCWSRVLPECGGRAGHVLLHPARPRWVLVNDAGLRTAGRLIAGCSDEAAAADLAGDLGVPLQRVRRDVAAFRAQWRAAGMDAPPADEPPARARRPVTLDIHLTRACNLACIHCYARDPALDGTENGAAAEAHLPREVVLRLLGEAAASGTEEVVLTGGEPLLYPWLEEVADAAAGRFQLALATNGTRVDAPRADWLAGHGFAVQVSLDGPDEQTHDTVRGAGAFAAALAGIRRLSAAGLARKLTLACTLSEATLAGAEAMVELAEDLGAARLRFITLRRRGAARERWRELGAPLTASRLEALYERLMGRAREGACRLELSCGLSGLVLRPEDESPDGLWCPLGRRLVVTADGGAYPCDQFLEPRFRLGNVQRDSLADILESPVLDRLVRSLAGRPVSTPGCRECPWRRLCQGGCMGLALHDTGDPADVDRFCAYRRRLYERAFERLLRRMLERESEEAGERQPEDPVTVPPDSGEVARDGPGGEPGDGPGPAEPGPRRKDRFRAAYRLLDVHVELRSDIGAVLDAIDEDFRRFRTSGAVEGVSGGRLRLAAGFGSMAPWLEVDGRRFDLRGHPDPVQFLGQQFVDGLLRRVRAYHVLHAAVVAREGRALVLAGPPGTGKSTLTEALVERGWEFYSDDYCPVALSDGRVHPFPRALRRVSAEPGAAREAFPPKLAVQPDPLGFRVGTSPARAAALVWLSSGDDGERAGREMFLRVLLRPGGETALADPMLGEARVGVEPLEGDPRQWRLRYRRRPKTDRALKEWFERHRDQCWTFCRENRPSPDFRREPRWGPLPAAEMLRRLWRDMKRPSGIGGPAPGENNDARSPGRTLFELHGLLGAVPAWRLTVGRLGPAVNWLASLLET